MLFVSRLYRKLALAHVCRIGMGDIPAVHLGSGTRGRITNEMSSMSQAAYHGVPVAALPFFGDQPGNAGQAVARVWTSYPFLYICIPWFLPLR